MNKMRTGKDGKTSEMRRMGRRWRNLERKFGFVKVEHDSRIFGGHHDRTAAVLCITKNGVVRGKSWTRQTLTDVWESTNWEGFVWFSVAIGGSRIEVDEESHR